LFFRRIRLVLTSFFVGMTFLMSGCESLRNLPDNNNDKSLVQEGKVSVEKLTGQQTYLVMVSELLMQKNDPNPAFELMFQVAEQTQSEAVAARAFEIAMQTYQEKSISQATELWKNLNPNSVKAWKSAYLLSVRKGFVQQALKEWEHYKRKALAEQTSNGLEDILLNTAIRVTQTANSENGLNFLMRLATQYSEEDIVHYGVGISAVSYQRYELALQALDEANIRYERRIAKEVDFTQPTAGFEPVNPTPEVNQMIRDLKVHKDIQHQRADAYLKTDQFERGLRDLTDYANAASEDWVFHERFSRLEVKAERYHSAEKRYQRILNQNDNAHTSRFAIALLSLEKKDYPVADYHLRKLTSVNGYKSISNYYWGVSLQEQKKFKAARQKLEMVEASSHWVDAQLHLAEMDALEFGIDKAVDRIDQSIALMRTESKAHGHGSDEAFMESELKLFRGKGLLYHQVALYEPAIAAYQEGLVIDSRHIPLLLSQAVAYYELKLLDAYEQNLRKVIRLQPNEVEALNALGYFFVEDRRDLAQAEKLLNKALSLAPTHYYILDSVGWLAYHQQDYSRAEALLEKALSIQVDGEVLFHLFKVKLKLAKKGEVQALWQKYQPQLSPKDAMYSKLEDLVKELTSS